MIGFRAIWEEHDAERQERIKSEAEAQRQADLEFNELCRRVAAFAKPIVEEFKGALEGYVACSASLTNNQESKSISLEFFIGEHELKVGRRIEITQNGKISVFVYDEELFREDKSLIFADISRFEIDFKRLFTAMVIEHNKKRDLVVSLPLETPHNA